MATTLVPEIPSTSQTRNRSNSRFFKRRSAHGGDRCAPLTIWAFSSSELPHDVHVSAELIAAFPSPEKMQDSPLARGASRYYGEIQAGLLLRTQWSLPQQWGSRDHTNKDAVYRASSTVEPPD